MDMWALDTLAPMNSPPPTLAAIVASLVVACGGGAGTEDSPSNSSTAGEMSAPDGGARPDGGGASPVCEPDCRALECGPDPVCNELDCGSCEAGFDCSAGACVAAKMPATNGETCTHGSECASQTCALNMVGEGHCYGHGQADDLCGDPYDCDAGSCISETGLDESYVCVPGIAVCQADANISDDCTEAAVVQCQVVQYCGSAGTGNVPAKYASFDFCIGSECNAIAGLSRADCAAYVNATLSLSDPCI